jgi:hypothetical protein
MVGEANLDDTVTEAVEAEAGAEVAVVRDMLDVWVTGRCIHVIDTLEKLPPSERHGDACPAGFNISNV